MGLSSGRELLEEVDDVMAEHSPLEDFLTGISERVQRQRSRQKSRFEKLSKDKGALRKQFDAVSGFAGGGTVKAVRGLAPGLGITLGGRQVVKGGLRRINKAANQGKPLQGTGEMRGGQKPTTKQLFDMAIRKQREPEDARSFEKFMKKVDTLFDDLKPKNLNRSSSISEQGLRKNIGGQRPPNAELEALALRKQEATRISQTIKKARKERLVERTKELENNPNSAALIRKLERLFDED